MAIDARVLLGTDVAARQEAARELDRELKSQGFVQLSGIFELEPELRSHISEALSFFALPRSERVRLTRDVHDVGSLHRWRGYTCEESDDQVLNESLSVGDRFGASTAPRSGADLLTEPTPLPRGLRPAWPTSVMESRTILSRIATRILEVLATRLTIGSDAVTELFAPPNLSTLRLIRYPGDDSRVARSETSRDATRSAVRIRPHTDTSALSLGWQSAPGLEVLDRNGDWHAVAHNEAEWSIHSGQMLEAVTLGEYVATTHRVLVGQGTRHSILCFLEPRADTTLAPWVAPEQHDSQSSNTTYGSWLLAQYGLSNEHA